MATRHSSPLRAPLGLLLLLIGVISSHLPQAQGAPADFWCNSRNRERLERKTESMNMADCVGSDRLSSPVQLPCVWLHAAEWANKTLSQKCAEVVGALQMFKVGVEKVKNQTTAQCHTVLASLDDHITNYLALVNSLQSKIEMVTPSPPAGQNCSSLTSPDKLLGQYRKLLKGKVERLAIDVRDSFHCDKRR